MVVIDVCFPAFLVEAGARLCGVFHGTFCTCCGGQCNQLPYALPTDTSGKVPLARQSSVDLQVLLQSNSPLMGVFCNRRHSLPHGPSLFSAVPDVLLSTVLALSFFLCLELWQLPLLL